MEAFLHSFCVADTWISQFRPENTNKAAVFHPAVSGHPLGIASRTSPCEMMRKVIPEIFARLLLREFTGRIMAVLVGAARGTPGLEPSGDRTALLVGFCHGCHDASP